MITDRKRLDIMGDIDKKKKAFISYAWESSDDFVLSLATQLQQDGIDIVLDKWNLEEGQDKLAFMEQCVSNPDIDKVLIICDKIYTERADNRIGGVGIETMVISSAVYENVQQTKCIPIVTEVDNNGEPYLPIYLRARKYIDFSNNSHYEEAYEKLLEVINDSFSYQKPSLVEKEKTGKGNSNILCNKKPLDHLINCFNEGIKECHIIEIMRNDPIEGMPRNYANDMAGFCLVMEQRLDDNILLQKDNTYLNIKEFCNGLSFYNSYLAKHLNPDGNDYYGPNQMQSYDKMRKEINDIKTHLNECYQIINQGCSLID